MQTIVEELKTSVQEDGDDDGSFNTKKEASIFLGENSYDKDGTKLKAPHRQRLCTAFSLDVESQRQNNLPLTEKNKLFRHYTWTCFPTRSSLDPDFDDVDSDFSFDLERDGSNQQEVPVSNQGSRVRILSGVDYSRGRSCAVDLTVLNKKKKHLKTKTMQNIKIMRAFMAQINSKKGNIRKNTEHYSLKPPKPTQLLHEEDEEEIVRCSTFLNDGFNSVNPMTSSLLIEKISSPEMPLTNLGDLKLISSKSNPVWACTKRDYIVTALTNPENIRDSLRVSFAMTHKPKQIILDTSKVKSFIAQLAQEAANHNIIDAIKLDERKSDEPYILYKRGESKLVSMFTTNIQAIDLDKFLNLICEYKPSFNENALRFLEFQRSTFLRILLLCHDLFCSSLDLLIQLIKRFFIATPSKMSQKEALMYDKCIRTPAQYIILDIIATWIEIRGKDFFENNHLCVFLESFIQYTSSGEAVPSVNERIKKALKLLSNYLKKNNTNFTNDSKTVIKTETNLFDSQISQMLMLNINVEMDIEGITEYFFRYNAKQMAANMTRIDLRYLKALRIRHLPHNSMNLEDFISEEEKFAFVSHTNYLTFLMVYLIIGQQKHQKTEELILRLVDIAEELLRYNNFQSFSCIMGAITNTATKVYSKSIKESSSQVLRKKKKGFEDLFNNTTAFRNTINKTHLPKIPSIMIINEDLTKLLGMQDTYIELDNDRKLINFKLLEETAAVIDGLDRAQKSTYEFREIKPELEGFLMDQPKKLMKKLDHRMNISQIQTELMKIAHKNVRINSNKA